MTLVRSYPSESAAWLAAARVAANGGPADLTVRRSRDRLTVALFAANPADAITARTILERTFA